MNKHLYIYSDYPYTVAQILLSEGLIESGRIVEQLATSLKIVHPDDGMNKCLKYWLDVAQSIGLITQYSFNQQSRRP